MNQSRPPRPPPPSSPRGTSDTRTADCGRAEACAASLAGIQSPREREVLMLMAEGHDNTTIAKTLFITERAVSKHIGGIFVKLGLPQSDSGHRRVLAVLAYLNNV